MADDDADSASKGEAAEAERAEALRAQIAASEMRKSKAQRRYGNTSQDNVRRLASGDVMDEYDTQARSRARGGGYGDTIDVLREHK